MGFHAFSLDPRTILGVGPDASMEEIHEAYRAKSKKYHPDMGGDEWAFRMVARAYEVLKTTAAEPPRSNPWEARGADAAAAAGRSDDWAWTWGAGSRGPGGNGATTDGSAAATAQSNGTGAADEPDESDRAGSASGTAEGRRFDSSRIRTVGVELIWTRFEKDVPAHVLSDQDPDDATLSVCMVMAWPPEELVRRTAEFPAAAETLRTLIDLFERLRGQKAVVAGRSRIEDGRFVGWLSYPDVLTAQDAIVALRETCRTHGLSITLQTRDERIPFDWHLEADPPVMSQAS
ncbi:MAG: J domain-containing protein [Isosphaeraceae bacterium]